MLNGSRTEYDLSSENYLVVPSYRHFSKIRNNGQLSALFMVFEWLLTIISFCGIHYSFPIVLGLMLALDIKLMANSKRVKTKYLDDIVKIENLFHQMSKEDQKRFTKYINAVYEDPKDYELKSKVQNLFNEHAIPVKVENIKDSLNNDLQQIQITKEIMRGLPGATND